LGGKLVLTSWNGFVAQAGQSFDLLDWGTTSGVFKSIDASGFMLAAGTQLDYSQLYSSGTISVTAVPEPESYLMLLAGLGLLAWRRRKTD
ncbi:MAG: PEP-CTERM sorting domain-containing protein, partial [Burkholderiales bacterium]